MFTIRRSFFAMGAAASLALAAPAISGLSASQINSVVDNMRSVSHKSWEIGTMTEALLEINWPQYSVFGELYAPPPSDLHPSVAPTAVFDIVNRVISDRPPNILPLTTDSGSVADPASIGPAVLLANWTSAPLDTNVTTYGRAAKDQLQYLLTVAPKSAAGAISHRADQVQLWSDYISMAPPFIGYFGALKNNRTLLYEAYKQCKLYRDALRHDPTGLWKHIVLGNWQDNNIWATGNGWAASGMLRVMQTIKHTPFASDLSSETNDLQSWIQEIIDASWKYQTPKGALRNYIDNPATFEDSAGTAILAAVTYRMAAITGDTSLITNANKAFTFIKSKIDDDGWLLDPVDPMKFNVVGRHSPEGQAFVSMLQAAWRDYTSQAKSSKTPMQLVGGIIGLNGIAIPDFATPASR